MIGTNRNSMQPSFNRSAMQSKQSKSKSKMQPAFEGGNFQVVGKAANKLTKQLRKQLTEAASRLAEGETLFLSRVKETNKNLGLKLTYYCGGNQIKAEYIATGEHKVSNLIAQHNRSVFTTTMPPVGNSAPGMPVGSAFVYHVPVAQAPAGQVGGLLPGQPPLNTAAVFADATPVYNPYTQIAAAHVPDPKVIDRIRGGIPSASQDPQAILKDVNPEFFPHASEYGRASQMQDFKSQTTTEYMRAKLESLKPSGSSSPPPSPEAAVKAGKKVSTEPSAPSAPSAPYAPPAWPSNLPRPKETPTPQTPVVLNQPFKLAPEVKQVGHMPMQTKVPAGQAYGQNGTSKSTYEAYHATQQGMPIQPGTIGQAHQQMQQPGVWGTSSQPYAIQGRYANQMSPEGYEGMPFVTQPPAPSNGHHRLRNAAGVVGDAAASAAEGGAHLASEAAGGLLDLLGRVLG